MVVFANGNGGPSDNANDDGFAAHPTTIAVSSLGDDDRRAPYAEYGTSVDVVAPSSGGLRGVVTADLVGAAGYADGNATTSFGGTSAAAPVVGGVAALVLAANPALRGSDVRRILVESAVRVHAEDPDWTRNAAGRWFSPWYGFGVVDARAAVDLARTTPPTRADDDETCSDAWTAGADLGAEWYRVDLRTSREVDVVDRVVVEADVDHPRRGDVLVRVVSPAGTASYLTTIAPTEALAPAPLTNAFGERASRTGRVRDAGRATRARVRAARSVDSERRSPAPVAPLRLRDSDCGSAWAALAALALALFLVHRAATMAA